MHESVSCYSVLCDNNDAFVSVLACMSECIHVHVIDMHMNMYTCDMYKYM